MRSMRAPAGAHAARSGAAAHPATFPDGWRTSCRAHERASNCTMAPTFLDASIGARAPLALENSIRSDHRRTMLRILENSRRTYDYLSRHAGTECLCLILSGMAVQAAGASTHRECMVEVLPHHVVPHRHHAGTTWTHTGQRHQAVTISQHLPACHARVLYTLEGTHVLRFVKGTGRVHALSRALAPKRLATRVHMEGKKEFTRIWAEGGKVRVARGRPQRKQLGMSAPHTLSVHNPPSGFANHEDAGQCQKKAHAWGGRVMNIP